MAWYGGISSLLGGGPSGEDVLANQKYLQGPNQANYTAGNQAVQASYQPVSGMAQQGQATSLIGQSAAGNGPSLARANMQQGLSLSNNAIQAQSMSNQGNIGQGVSQRNLLNAQAAGNNNYIGQAGQASVAEQMGAQANYASAANAQASTALNQHQQQLTAYGLQGQQQMAYDQGIQNLGTQKANLGLQATNADAKQLGIIGQRSSDVASGLGALAVGSDENMKQDIKQTSGTDNKISSLLSSLFPAQTAAPAAAAPSSGGDGLLHPGSGIQLMGGANSQDYGGFNPSKAAGGMAAAGMPLEGATSALAVMSDENCKQGMGQPSGSQLHDFMGKMEPSTFQYKDQGYSAGEHLGVMAQDVDNSKIGNDMVEQQPGGYKGINIPKALGATLASLAYLNQRIDKLGGAKSEQH